MSPIEPGTHVKKLNQHRTILFVAVVILLVIQITSFVSLTSQITRLHATQSSSSEQLKATVNDMREETQYKINELVRELTSQRREFENVLVSQQKDFEAEIEKLQAQQKDFSNVINKSIRGVVSVGTDKSSGTGFIVDSSGYVVTNNHVIDDVKYVKVLTYNNIVYDATIIGTDATTDVALLKISGIFDHLELADSNQTQIGEKVIAIGNPLGLSFSVTEGIVSALHRRGPNNLETYTQTDVTLNPGNSGGPLINTEGKVIGMNNFKIGGAEGLGFALESEVIKSAVNTFANRTLIN